MRTDTHMGVWGAEQSGWLEDYRWDRFAENVMTILRIDSLDGEASEDGYSLDEAYDSFKAGELASEYAGVVRARLLAWGRV